MKKKTKSKKKVVPALPIPHFVCSGGCKSVSVTLGKCTTSGCPRSRNPLSECKCKNGKHGKLLFLNATKMSR